MKFSKTKAVIYAIVAYKLLVNIIFGIFGIAILRFSCDLERLAEFIILSGMVKPENGIFVKDIVPHVNVTHFGIACFFSLCLIVFAFLEIFFTIMMLKKKRWGAIGLSIVSSIWILLSFFFARELLVFSTKIGLMVDIAIISFLVYAVRETKDYFKN
jgi:hypothetical protein